MIPLVRGGTRSRQRRGRARARSAAASPRATARSCSRASTSAASATARPGYALPRLDPRGRRDRRARAAAALVDRDQPRRRRADRRDARDADRLAPPARAAPVRRRRRAAARWAAATASTRTWRKLEPLEDFNLTSDVIVGFPAEDEAAFERTLGDRRARPADEGARLPVLAAAGHGDRGRGHGRRRP